MNKFHDHSLIFRDFAKLSSLKNESSGAAKIFYTALMNELSNVYKKRKDREKCILDIFNEAYWIFKRVVNYSSPEIHFDEYFPNGISDDGEAVESAEMAIIKAIVYGLLKLYYATNEEIETFINQFEFSDNWEDKLPTDLISNAIIGIHTIAPWDLPYEYDVECFDAVLSTLQKADDITSIYSFLKSVLCDFDELYFNEVMESKSLSDDRKSSFVSALCNLVLNKDKHIPQNIASDLFETHKDFIDSLMNASDNPQDFITYQSTVTQLANLSVVPLIYKSVFQNNIPLYHSFETFIHDSISPRTSQKTQSQTFRWKWWHVRQAFIELGFIDSGSSFSDFDKAIFGVITDRYKSYKNIASSRDDYTKNKPLSETDRNIINEIVKFIEDWLKEQEKPNPRQTPSTPPHYPGDLPF